MGFASPRGVCVRPRLCPEGALHLVPWNSRHIHTDALRHIRPAQTDTRQTQDRHIHSARDKRKPVGARKGPQDQPWRPCAARLRPLARPAEGRMPLPVPVRPSNQCRSACRAESRSSEQLAYAESSARAAPWPCKQARSGSTSTSIQYVPAVQIMTHSSCIPAVRAPPCAAPATAVASTGGAFSDFTEYILDLQSNILKTAEARQLRLTQRSRLQESDSCTQEDRRGGTWAAPVLGEPCVTQTPGSPALA